MTTLDPTYLYCWGSLRRIRYATLIVRLICKNEKEILVHHYTASHHAKSKDGLWSSRMY